MPLWLLFAFKICYFLDYCTHRTKFVKINIESTSSKKIFCSPLINHTALRNIHRPMEINQCAVLIYLYRPHKYSIIHQKLIVQLIIISTPGFTHTKNYTVSTKIYCTILTLILHHRMKGLMDASIEFPNTRFCPVGSRTD